MDHTPRHAEDLRAFLKENEAHLKPQLVMGRSLRCWLPRVGLAAMATLGWNSAADGSGVLVGVRSQARANDYKTLWLVSSGDALRLDGTVRGLLVPRSKEFWKVDVVSEACDAGGHVSAVGIVAGALGAPIPKLRPCARPELMELCKGWNLPPGEQAYGEDLRIRYVGPKYIAREASWMMSSCATHPDGSKTYHVSTLDRLDEDVQMGPEIVGQAREAKERAYGHCAEGDGDCAMMRDGFGIRDPVDWLITRGAGAWRLLVGLRSNVDDMSGNRYGPFELTLDKAIPVEMVGRTAPLPATLTVPEGGDALLAPDGDLLILRDGGQLSAVAVKRGRPIGTPKVIDTDVGDIVLAEWASDAYLKRWSEAVWAAGK